MNANLEMTFITFSYFNSAIFFCLHILFLGLATNLRNHSSCQYTHLVISQLVALYLCYIQKSLTTTKQRYYFYVYIMLEKATTIQYPFQIYFLSTFDILKESARQLMIQLVNYMITRRKGEFSTDLCFFFVNYLITRKQENFLQI